MLAGKFVKESNEAGDDLKIPDIRNIGFGGTTGTVGSIPGLDILGFIPGIIGSIPGFNGGVIPGFNGGVIPGIGGGGIPAIGGGGIPAIGGGGIPWLSGGGIPGIGGIRGIGGGIYGGGYPGQRGYRGGLRCPYGCCAWAGGYCTSCCTI